MARSQEIPRMIRGTVVVQRRRCGKGNCHCADGRQLHETTVLSYSAEGRSRTLMLDAADVAKVRASVERYRAAQSRLESAGSNGLAVLLERRAGVRRNR